MFSVHFFLADHVYGDQEMHSEVRRRCMDYMVNSHAKKYKYNIHVILFNPLTPVQFFSLLNR